MSQECYNRSNKSNIDCRQSDGMLSPSHTAMPRAVYDENKEVHLLFVSNATELNLSKSDIKNLLEKLQSNADCHKTSADEARLIPRHDATICVALRARRAKTESILRAGVSLNGRTVSFSLQPQVADGCTVRTSRFTGKPDEAKQGELQSVKNEHDAAAQRVVEVALEKWKYLTKFNADKLRRLEGSQSRSPPLAIRAVDGAFELSGAETDVRNASNMLHFWIAKVRTTRQQVHNPIIAQCLMSSTRLLEKLEQKRKCTLTVVADDCNASAWKPACKKSRINEQSAVSAALLQHNEATPDETLSSLDSAVEAAEFFDQEPENIRARVEQVVIEVMYGNVMEQTDVEGIVIVCDNNQQSSDCVTCDTGGGLFRSGFTFSLRFPSESDRKYCLRLPILKRCLEMAEAKRCRSIALPAVHVHTGEADQQLAQVAQLILDAVEQFASEQRREFLRLVRVCAFPQQALRPMQDALLDRLNDNGQRHTGHGQLWKPFASAAESKPEMPVASGKDRRDDTRREDHGSSSAGFSLVITYEEENVPGLVFKDMERFVQNNVRQKELNDEAIGGLEQPIRTLCSRNRVDVSVSCKKVVLRGLRRDVDRAYSEILMLLLNRSVRWEYESYSNNYEPYDETVNQLIEEAHKLGKTSVDLVRFSAGRQCDVTVRFDDMVEVDKKTNQLVLVKRSDLSKLSEVMQPPKTWRPMQDCLNRVCDVALSQSDAEFHQVSALFQQSVTQKMATILEIKRIQNLELHSKYAIHKRAMLARVRQRKPDVQVERRLFHGTSEDALASINKYGFNRSYCGKNATAYGNGVYFALEAQYSAQSIYSCPNKRKEKFMYLCRVLVGESTLGSRGLIVPPKNPDTNEQYDSVSDNQKTIFVVFSDTQAYPEYLIKFQINK